MLGFSATCLFFRSRSLLHGTGKMQTGWVYVGLPSNATDSRWDPGTALGPGPLRRRGRVNAPHFPGPWEGGLPAPRLWVVPKPSSRPADREHTCGCRSGSGPVFWPGPAELQAPTTPGLPCAVWRTHGAWGSFVSPLLPPHPRHVDFACCVKKDENHIFEGKSTNPHKGRNRLPRGSLWYAAIAGPPVGLIAGLPY